MEDSSLLAHYEAQEKWTRARRGVLVQRVVSTQALQPTSRAALFDEWSLWRGPVGGNSLARSGRLKAGR